MGMGADVIPDFLFFVAVRTLDWQRCDDSLYARRAKGTMADKLANSRTRVEFAVPSISCVFNSLSRYIFRRPSAVSVKTRRRERCILCSRC